ncbi:hypothetical protein RCG24_11250 [Neobacillus sp. OS1-32]|jgi:hypothetical protein|uniref:Uncharacterized protein n=1 Tax=Neobacillus paridis TaxID=2803862 RepID=A0ABS1TRT9_9BACI|nr:MULTISPECIES: hypothetical protein [Neobacillus]MBL4953749.1 hypothetical protein [Neobacillus paridis]WML28626.1 hypothetical protein RCG24_11250 [Neobacillus sp. OS1-32]
MARTVKANTIGSSTIKRNGAVVKGTKGNRIANLSNLKENVRLSRKQNA